MEKLKLFKIPIITIFLVLLIDQCLKFWIKTHMIIGDEFSVIGNWFIIHFTENNGMAFGYEFGISYGKLILSLFRIIVIGLIGWYTYMLCLKNASKGLIIGFSLIIAGAIGNILDSVFYGMIFSDSYFHLATLFPKEGGYSSILQGKVVDMLYFPIIQTNYPSWFPFWKNEELVFFRPVFNIADASISIGVCYMILFQRKFFLKSNEVVSN